MLRNKLAQFARVAFLCSILSAAFAMRTAHAADTIKLAENGKALAVIEVAPQAPVVTRSVAQEMARYLERMSGARFEVTNAPGNGARIVLGRNDEFSNLKYGDKLRGNGQEAFLMRTEGDRVLLLGVTDRAVSHAAYTFLEKLGVRWFFPTQEWEVVPSQSTLTASFDEVQSPDLSLHRSIWYGGMTGYVDANVIRSDWMRHNRMKVDGPAQSHSWVGLDRQKDFKEHPEWFALVNGKRRNSQPNYGHPEVIKKAVQYGLNAAETGADSISVSAPDGLGFCECDQCLQVAGVTRESVHKINSAIFGKRPDGTLVCVTSETIFRMANAVAKAVGEKYPNVLISVFSYSGYAHPPTFDFEPNIYVPVTSAYRRTPLTLEEQIQAFGNKAKQIGIYDYYNIAAWHGFKPNAGKKMADLQEQMQFYHANRVLGVNAEATNNWAAAGLDYYVASKLMWDVDADVDALYTDFLEKAFGAAHGPMRNYYDRWESKTKLNPATTGAAINDLLTAYRLADTKEAKTRIAQLYLFMRFVRLDQERKDTADPERAAEAAQEFADLAWRIKDIKLLHEWVNASVNRPMVPAFTVQEIESLMAQDREWLKNNQNLFLTYSRNLVPITTAGRAIPGLQPQPYEAGRFRVMQLIIPAKAGETVDVVAKPIKETANYRVTYLSTDDFQSHVSASQAEEIAEGETTGNVSFKSSRAGFYRVILREVDSVTSVSHPHAMDPADQVLQNAIFYFFVPKGTKQFTISFAAQNSPTVKVRNAAGETVFERDGSVPTGGEVELEIEAEIAVPAGQDGAIWSATGPGGFTSRSRLHLDGVPQYLSFRPQQLLVAEGYLK